MKLLVDCISYEKKGVKIRKAGTEVKLIGDHGNVMVVEDKEGRFTVLKENVGD